MQGDLGSLALLKLKMEPIECRQFCPQFLGQTKIRYFSQTIEVGIHRNKGNATETKTKEKSIQANDFKILSKNAHSRKMARITGFRRKIQKKIPDLIF